MMEQENASCEDVTQKKKSSRIAGSLVLLAGAAVSTALIFYNNFFAVTSAVWQVGWGLALIALIQFLSLALNGLAWQMVFRPAIKGHTRLLFIIRWIRESINYLLPSALFGGDIVAVRLLTDRGSSTTNSASAGLVVDKTMEAAGLFFFSLAGISLLFERFEQGEESIPDWVVPGLIAIFSVFLILLMAQRWGLLKLVDKAVSKLSGRCGRQTDGENRSIHDIVWSIYSDIRKIIPAVFLHMLAWMPGTIQVWIALHYMGYAIPYTEAFVVESLSQVICAAAFVMPASLGAQEAAYMTIGMVFGIPPAAGLALSLVHRLKDISFGIPGLLIWQFFEGRRIWMLWRGKR